MNTRTVALTCAVPVVLACESSPELPTAVEGYVPFSRIIFDRVSMAPEPDRTLDVGEVMPYDFTAFFEFSAADLAQRPYSSASLDFDAYRYYETSDDWGTPVTMFSEWQGLEEGTSKGSVRAGGSFRVPSQDTFCGRYDRLTVEASIGYESEQPRQKSEKGTASGLSVSVDYPVEGSQNPADPCVYYKYWPAGYDHAWGEPVEWTKVVQVQEDDSVAVHFGDGPPAFEWGRTFDEGFIGTVAFIPPSLELDVVIPTGAGGGDQRVLVEGVKADWGAGLVSRFPIPFARDFGDPDNDRWDMPREDTWAWPDGANVAFWGPELAMAEGDQVPDPSANPFGSDEFGRGDWWLLPVEQDHEMCILVEVGEESGDDVDLFLVDDTGAPMSAVRTDNGWQEWLRLDAQAGDSLRLWVAPRITASEYGWYGLLAQECFWFDDPPSAAAPGSPGAGSVRGPGVKPKGVVRP